MARTVKPRMGQKQKKSGRWGRIAFGALVLLAVLALLFFLGFFSGLFPPPRRRGRPDPGGRAGHQCHLAHDCHGGNMPHPENRARPFARPVYRGAC